MYLLYLCFTECFFDKYIFCPFKRLKCELPRCPLPSAVCSTAASAYATLSSFRRRNCLLPLALLSTVFVVSASFPPSSALCASAATWAPPATACLGFTNVPLHPDKMFYRASLVLVSAVVFLACRNQTSAWVWFLPPWRPGFRWVHANSILSGGFGPPWYATSD